MAYQKITGRKSSISTTAVRLSDDTDRPKIGLQVLAASDNAGVVYIGFSDQVTADAADSTDGFPLTAGAGIALDDQKPHDIWAIADTGTNKVFYIGV